MTTPADRLHAALRRAANPRRAEQEKRYLNSEIEHYGVSVPTVRALVKQAVRDNPALTRAGLIDQVRSLWATQVHECRLAAALLLDACSDRLSPRDTVLLEQLIRQARTWALVDVLAGRVAGRLLLRCPEVEAEYRRWGGEEDQWVRRAGLLAFLPAVRNEAYVDRYLPVVASIADLLLEDRRFFVRKAIGWVLREAGKRRPDAVFAWLQPRVARASGVTIREAVRHLPEQPPLLPR